MGVVTVLAAIASALALLALPSHAAETEEVSDFAPNPGDLLMFKYVPDGLPVGAPLVVALHGCTQSARAFDDESGWTGLADRFRFAVVLPQQRESNNSDLCFNFFSADDNRRGRGEAASVNAMVDAMVAAHGTDRNRTFVVGHSAGGAMAAVMLAAYPEVFRAGAVIAGVPYGCASTGGNWLLEIQRYWVLVTNPYGEAAWAAYRCGIDRSALFPLKPAARDPQEWSDLVREADGASPAAWPRVSLWHGGKDATVHPQNLTELIEQWTALHGVDQVPDREEETAVYRRREYKDARGETRVEAFDLPDLGHAVPVDPGSGPAACGRVVPPYFVDAGICAAFRIASFWGLVAGGPE